MTNHPNRSKQQQPTHTPGPWRVGRKLSNCVVVTAEGKDIGTVSINKYTDNAINEANARLIATAPELLAALKTLVGLLDVQADEMEEAGIAILPEREAARAIIDKAEGR